jgi:CDP-diacylglycerol---serine O-phosphatidyltransferase
MRVRHPRSTRPARHREHPRLRRGIFLLPSLFTVGNMLAGFASLLHAINGHLQTAAWLVLLAALLDSLDGRIARLTRATSDFGKEYDSLADVVSFGVAPAVLIYEWALFGLGRWGWAMAFLYLVAGSVRLARFNVRAPHEDGHYFTGLPIPGGAGAMALLVLLRPEPVPPSALAVVVWAVVLAVSLLMVSTVPYRSYKDFKLRERWPATAFFLFALIIAVIVVSPRPAMAAVLGGYILLGPIDLVLRWLRERARAARAEDPPATREAEAHD